MDEGGEERCSGRACQRAKSHTRVHLVVVVVILMLLLVVVMARRVGCVSQKATPHNRASVTATPAGAAAAADVRRAMDERGEPRGSPLSVRRRPAAYAAFREPALVSPAHRGPALRALRGLVWRAGGRRRCALGVEEVEAVEKELKLLVPEHQLAEELLLLQPLVLGHNHGETDPPEVHEYEWERESANSAAGRLRRRTPKRQ